jgi:crotonobetainyl-CoA:carnitine CoA-transferase CaiB-like acyl-CoA transferase
VIARVDEPGTERLAFLAGLSVLELGDGVAGACATGILRMLGASVTTVIDPQSVHRTGLPRVPATGPGASLLAACLDRGKHLVPVGDGPWKAVIGSDPGSYDVIVADRVGRPRPGFADLADADTYRQFVARANRHAWVTISAFGLTGRRAADVATDLTVGAAAGVLSVVRDPRTGQPLKLAGQQSLLTAGQAAALAACHALDLAADGTPVHLDVAAVDAALAMGPVLEIGGLLLGAGSAAGARRYGAPASYYPCVDGAVRISAMEDHQWRGIVTAMGSPLWAERFATVARRIADADEIDGLVADWTRSRPKFEVESLLQANGVPCTAVRTAAEIVDSAQLRHRGTAGSLTLDDGCHALVVDSPARIVARGSVDDGGEPRTLRGLRVLEASHVLAVPLAGAILGALGADVIKLEDTARLDMYRRRGPYVDGREGPDRSVFFALMNHSKRSVAFDVERNPDRLADLTASVDVITENLGRKRADALRLSATGALAEHPRVLALSSSGFGQDGPFADYRAYAYNVHAAAGVAHLTRSLGGEPAEMDFAWADLLTAYALATLVAAWAVGPVRNPGIGLDVAMSDLVISQFNEFIAAASVDGALEAGFERANDLAPYAPNGAYPALDGWVALSVETDDDLAGVAQVLGLESGMEPDRAGAPTRWDRRRILDRLIADATRLRLGGELAAALRATGVAAEQVARACDLVASEQLAGRGIFVPVTHPEWGERRLVGLPWIAVGAAPFPLGSPPLLEPLGV